MPKFESEVNWMYVRALVDILNKEFDADISTEHYGRIENWRDWWQGCVNSFHRFEEKNSHGGSKARMLYSLHMAKKICADWASILLNEKTRINIDDKGTSEYLQGADANGGVLDSIDFWTKSNELVEKAFYSGTGAFVLKIDGLIERNDGRLIPSPEAAVRMDYVSATSIIPLSQKYGYITEAAFVTESVNKGKKRLYLEIHTLENGRYVIENRYYDIEPNGSLSAVATPDRIAKRFYTNSPYAFFSILKPNAVSTYRNDLGLGSAVFSHAIDCLEGIDLAFNNFCRDFALGGKKVFYNRELTKTRGLDSNGNPVYITPDDMMQQLFVSIGDGVDLDEKTLVYEFNPSLRVGDNIAGLQAMLDYFTFLCGFGAGYYRFDSARGVVTATQYTGEKQSLKQNAAKHGIIVDKAIKDIVRAILWAGKNILGQPVKPNADIKVEFSDGYIVSDEEKYVRDIELLRDGILQPYEIRMRWLGEDEATAKAMTQGQEPMFGGREFQDGEDATRSTQVIDEAEKVAGKTLNGAQTQSLISVVNEFTAGNLTEGQAVNILMRSIGVTKDEAQNLLRGVVT